MIATIYLFALEVVALLYCIIIRYYLFPHWLSIDPGDDDHFAHFADE